MTTPVRTRRGLVPHRQPGPVRRGRRSPGRRPVAGRSPRRWTRADAIPATVVWKPVLTDSDAIRRMALEANADDRCVGVIAWMHTFSPGEDVDQPGSTRCASRCCTCTRRPTSSCPGARSTWTS